MPQETNFNITPYNDDYSPDDAFYRILFKPNPVQARELNSLQSILQNQIEQFGNHIFKEGSVVIPGNLNYDNDLSAVELQNDYNGISISSYLQLLVGKSLRGKTSGVRAVVILVQTQIESVRGNNTLYVKYTSSSLNTNTNSLFFDGEELVVEESSTNTLSTGELVIFSSGQTVALTLSSNCNSVASSVTVSDGVYFVRGAFVNVFKHTILLDQYSNKVSCKVGFNVNERIVTAYDNPTLFDNSSGFSNYTAPGADRFTIELLLAKYDLDEEKPNNFVQLLEIQNGTLISKQNIPEYNELSKELARRTFNESGNYYVNPPVISINNSLNNFLGNGGIYRQNDITYNGNSPSESLGIYKISPIKAIVQGYEVDTGVSFVDFQKPRTTKLLQNQEVNYYTGPSLTLNRVYGSPYVGITTNYTLSLRDSRVEVNQTAPAGKEIGLARVYDFALESGSYSATNQNVNEWDISLFDIQTYTEIALNQALDSDNLYNVPCKIEGSASGASGYIRYDTRNSGIVTAYEVRGTFAIGENLSFNGIENNRVSIAVTSYSLNNVKSVYGIVGTAFTFTADVKQALNTPIGQVNITPFSPATGISTVTKLDYTFDGIASVGNLVAFTTPGISTINYARVTEVSSNSLKIVGVTTVTGICEGKLPATTINPSDFTILSSSFSASSDNALYTKLPKEKISNVDLTNSNIVIKKQIDVTISSNSVGPINADTNETFLSFDEERYALIREDGTMENLSSDKFSFTNGSATLTINGLGTDSKAKLIATLRKVNVKEKVKYKNRIKTLIVDKSKYNTSGIGTTTLNDGLTHGNFPYGTRVQDEEISLLTPEVTKLYGIFESSTLNSATLPTITLSSLSGPTNKTDDLIVGEQLTGETTNAVAIYVGKVNDLAINLVFLNDTRFQVNELVTFKETGITANVDDLVSGDSNITSHYTFDYGQKSTIYDFSTLKRKPNYKEPLKKLTILFESADFLTSDVGDLITVNSYNNFDYCNLPKVNSFNTSDIIDIRPRVANFNVTEGSRSPFEFLGRSFTQKHLNTQNILASDESINLDYSFYLPRIDKLFLTAEGRIELINGYPDETPQPPLSLDSSIELASIYLPAYLCDMSEGELNLKMYKRYRMEDIKLLEDRISNLEYYTSLTLLESDTSKLFIPDRFGNNRFKSGFFVDNFSNTASQIKITEVKNSIDLDEGEMRPAPYTTELDLIIASKSIIGIGTVAETNVDLNYIDDLLGTNIKKTGNLLTLDYDEVVEIVQPYSTRVESVSAYRNNIFKGSITLSPSSDVWSDQVKVSTNYVSARTLTPSSEQLAIAESNHQNGMNPILWDYVSKIWSEGNTLISSQIINYLRSRNIEFIAKKLKPHTRFYVFFDNQSLNNYVIPKLIQIQMVSGTFQVGETVIGTNPLTNSSIKFRVASSNHKYGPYDSPTTKYQNNPYDFSNTIPENYSSTATILNVDTYSLSNIVQSSFSGFIDSGMRLKGQTSSAEATVSADVKLITDEYGELIGSVFIPESTNSGAPVFETGSKIFRLTDSLSNSMLEGGSISFAETTFVATGNLNQYQENVVQSDPRIIDSTTTTPSIRPAPVQAPPAPSPPPWYYGDIVLGGSQITKDGEGQRLVNSINQKNGTSFTISQLMSAAGIKELNKISELNTINEKARQLAGR
jgi:hypothetical protein